MWVGCVKNYCTYKTCQDLSPFGYLNCPININQPCNEGGCICINGYVRNEQGICIPMEQCGQYIIVITN